MQLRWLLVQKPQKRQHCTGNKCYNALHRGLGPLCHGNRRVYGHSLLSRRQYACAFTILGVGPCGQGEAIRDGAHRAGHRAELGPEHPRQSGNAAYVASFRFNRALGRSISDPNLKR